MTNDRRGRTRMFVKNCECKTTSASGPRSIQERCPEHVNDGYVFRYVRVERACDSCDTPWVEFPAFECGGLHD